MISVFSSFLFSPAYATDLPYRASSETIVSLSTASPAGAINNIYNFALGIGALVAFGIIVYAALEYTMTESSSKRSEAQGRIYQALLGLVLLLGATVVLRFIDPGLTSLKNPTLPELSRIGVAPAGSGAVAYWTFQACSASSGCTPELYQQNFISATKNFSSQAECIDFGNHWGGVQPENWRCIQIVPADTSGTSGPDCSPIASGPGSVEDITTRLAGTPYAGCFGTKIEKASGVIRVESGGNPASKSGSDRCNPGPQSASIGLFQINLTWHNVGGLQCASPSGAFTGHFNRSPNDCSVTNQARYDQCVAAASDPTFNIIEACKTFKEGGNSFSRWGPQTRQKCGI